MQEKISPSQRLNQLHGFHSFIILQRRLSATTLSAEIGCYNLEISIKATENAEFE